MKNKNTREKLSKQAIFDTLRSIGQTLFTPESLEKGINQEHIEKAKSFLSKGARITKPTVMVSYWGHLMIASELGKRTGEKIKKRYNHVNPLEIEFMLWLHDVGRLVVPTAYLRNDFIGNRLLASIGIPRKLRRKYPSLGKLLVAAEELHFTEKQLAFEEPLYDEQREIANAYFTSLTATQRIVNLADNLGKGGPIGIFTLQQFIEYLKTQEDRYPDHASSWALIHWANTDERRKKGAVLQAYVVEQTLKWIKEMDVNFDEIRNGLANHGPRFVVLARHGEVYNPTQIVYNRDSEMAEKDIVTIDNKGKVQMRELGLLIKKRGLIVKEIYSSPEKRAVESANELNHKLNITIQISEDLDEVYAPGPYKVGMTMDQLMASGSNVYEVTRWEEFKHENPQSIIERMKKIYGKSIQLLNAIEAVILVSHGDPIAWFVNTIYEQIIPDPEKLRNLIYPAKGEAILAVIQSDSSVFTFYSLNKEVLSNDTATIFY